MRRALFWLALLLFMTGAAPGSRPPRPPRERTRTGGSYGGRSGFRRAQTPSSWLVHRDTSGFDLATRPPPPPRSGCAFY